MANINFIRTTKQKWLERTEHNPNTLYFCKDTKEMFWGDSVVTDGIRIIPSRADLPECSCAADGIIYYVDDTRNGYMVSPDRDRWLQIIYAPALDVDAIPKGEEYNVVTTVGAVRDIEEELYQYVDEKFSVTIRSLKPADRSVVISTTAEGERTIGIAISEEKNNLLVKKADGLYAEATEAATYSVEKQTVVPNGYAASYKLKKTTEKETTYAGDAINIPDTSDLAKKTDIPSLDGYATEKFVKDEAAKIHIPTDVSELNNDSGFITNLVDNLVNYYTASQIYTREEVNQLVSAIPKFSIEVVGALPTESISDTTVYLLKSSEDADNLYTEYIYANGTWEILGAQKVDLTGYALEADIPTALSQLTDDVGYAKATDLQATLGEAKDYTDEKVAAIPAATWESLPDRPFGEEIIHHTPVWEGEAVFRSDDDSGTSYFIIKGINLDHTKSYVLIVNGETHGEFVCTSVDTSTYTETYTNITTDNYFRYVTFMKEFVDMGGADIRYEVTIYRYGSDGASFHIVLAEKPISIIHVLDEKFIPDTIARISDIPSIEEITQSVIAALPAAEEVEV